MNTVYVYNVITVTYCLTLYRDKNFTRSRSLIIYCVKMCEGKKTDCFKLYVKKLPGCLMPVVINKLLIKYNLFSYGEYISDLIKSDTMHK